MSKSFYIDYIRQIISQTLLQEHIKNPYLIGSENQVNLFSFYEQLVNQDEVDRYVEKYNELVGQQNRADLIANGIIASPENPTFTNLNSATIVPLSFMCSFRLKLEDRDLMLEAIDNLISIHKGRKVDIAQFDNGKLFMVGTVGNNIDGKPLMKVGDFFGVKANADQTLTQFIGSRISYFQTREAIWETIGDRTQYVYYEDVDGKLKVAYNNNGTWLELVDDGTKNDVVFPPEHNSFKKMKVSLSFDAMRCNEPRVLDGSELIEISFGGNATIVNRQIRLGNDLTKLSICKYSRVEQSGTVELNRIYYWLEPLDLPSSNNADTQINRLMSNKFIANTHTDSFALTLNYTFVVDTDITLLNQWYRYARYGEQSTWLTEIELITPNIIYRIAEFYSSWGEMFQYYFNAKIIDSIDIENNENDVLTLSLTFQLQGANN